MGRQIARSGTHIVIPYRDEDEKRHLKVAGDLGQITSLVSDFRLVYDTCIRVGSRQQRH